MLHKIIFVYYISKSEHLFFLFPQFVLLLFYADLRFNNSQLFWIIEWHLYIFLFCSALRRSTREQTVLATVAVNAMRFGSLCTEILNVEYTGSGPTHSPSSTPLSHPHSSVEIDSSLFSSFFFPVAVQVTATRCQTAVTWFIYASNRQQVEKNIFARITCSLVEMF